MSANPEIAFEGAEALGDRDFATVRQLIAEYAGIKLSLQKRNMVYNRLLRRLRARAVGSFGDYLPSGEGIAKFRYAVREWMGILAGA